MSNPGQPKPRERNCDSYTAVRLRMEQTASRMEERDWLHYTGSQEWLLRFGYGDGRLRPTIPMEPVNGSLRNFNGRVGSS